MSPIPGGGSNKNVSLSVVSMKVVHKSNEINVAQSSKNIDTVFDVNKFGILVALTCGCEFCSLHATVCKAI